MGLIPRLGSFAAVVLGTLVWVSAASAQTISIEASDKYTNFDEPIQIVGQLDAPQGAAGREVRLIAVRFPYTQEVAAGTTTTGADGSYRFDEVFTPHNTRYRVVVSDGEVSAESPQLQIWSIPTIDASLDVVGRRAITSVTFSYSPAWPGQFHDRDFYFYFHKKGTRYSRRIDRTFTELVAPGEVTAEGKWRLPRSRKPYRFFFGWCLQVEEAVTESIDIGMFEPGEGDCPKKFRVKGRMAVDGRSAGIG